MHESSSSDENNFHNDELTGAARGSARARATSNGIGVSDSDSTAGAGPWPLRRADHARAGEAALHISHKLNIHPLAARVMVSRGIECPDEARDFLQPRLEDVHDPTLMPGIDQAVTRILLARDRGERVRIYGDYDVDGVCGVVMLLHFMRVLGIETDYYIPHRLREGYGFHAEAAEAAAARGINLIITVDTGISDYEGVAAAREAGVDVIVTDHHDPPDELPPAAAVVHPFTPGSEYPYRFLAGAGVALKLIQAVTAAASLPTDSWTRYLDLAALATMADVMPLTGENRILTYYGLRRLRSAPRPGIVALCREARLDPRVLSSSDVTFMLSPRINAAGRIDHARAAVELLMADENDAPFRARRLEDANAARRDIQETILQEIQEELGLEQLQRGKGDGDGAYEEGPERSGSLPEVIFLGRAHWHPGVLGIVAGRLADELRVPVLLAQIDGDRWRGSGRSGPGFDLIGALRRCGGLLESYGGHAQAAGFTVEESRVDDFRRALSEAVATGKAEAEASGDAKSGAAADALMEAADVSSRLVADLARLEPFGEGNPPPLFAARLPVVEARTVGGGGEHLKLQLERRLGGIAFRRGHLLPRIKETGEIYALCTPEFNYWRGRREVQLRIEELETEGLPELPGLSEAAPAGSRGGPARPLLNRDLLGSLYKSIRSLAGSGRRPTAIPGEEIHRAAHRSGINRSSEEVVSLGLQVFAELGLVERGGPGTSPGEGGTSWRFLPTYGTVNLEDSPTFRKYGPR